MGGQGFWEGGSHDFQREGRGDQSSPTEYKGETIKKLTANLLPLKGGGVKQYHKALWGDGRAWQVALKLLLIVSHGLKNLVLIMDML